MMRLTFKRKINEEYLIFPLLEEIGKMPCRVLVDFEKGYVVTEETDQEMVDKIIELFDAYSTILEAILDDRYEEEEEEVEEIEDSMIPVTVRKVKEDPTLTFMQAISFTDKETPKMATKKEVGYEEVALLETLGFAFDKLDKSKRVEEQVDSFLCDIGMATTERKVKQSFIAACNIDKINYENVVRRLRIQFPQTEGRQIKAILKKTFKDWLTQYPALAEKCPKISFIMLLRVFVKKIS